MKKPILKLITAIIVIIIAAAFTGCTGQKNNILEPTNNLQEVQLPAEVTNINAIKTDENGNLIISNCEKKDDDSSATVMLWRQTDGGKWEKLFEKEFASDEPQKIAKEADIDLIGNKGIITDYDFSRNDTFSYKFNLHVAENIDKNETIKKFNSLKGYLFGPFHGTDIDNVYSVDFVAFKLFNIDFTTKEIKPVDELSDVTEMCSYKNLAYIIYRQDYELTEEEIANLTPGSDFPERYARGVIYDMDSGSITESKVLDKLAVRFFEKWHKGGENVYNYQPIYYPAIGYDKEAYYLAHNDGVYRIDEEGEELICFDQSWNSKKNCLNLMTVAENGDIYLCVYLNNYEEVKLYRIKP